jgi:hypothetical protein
LFDYKRIESDIRLKGKEKIQKGRGLINDKERRGV